jgi:hypothetical protein
MLMNACRLGLGRGMEFDDWVLPFQFSASYTDADGVLDQDTPLAELGPGPFVDVKTYGRGNDRARATRRARESRTTYVATPARETFCHTASFQFSTRGNYGNDENSATAMTGETATALTQLGWLSVCRCTLQSSESAGARTIHSGRWAMYSRRIILASGLNTSAELYTCSGASSMIELWLSRNRFASYTTAPRPGGFSARLGLILAFNRLNDARDPVVVLPFILLALENNKGGSPYR